MGMVCMCIPSAIEAMASGKDDDEDQCNEDTQDNELYLHILQPHLPPHVRPLLPEILRL